MKKIEKIIMYIMMLWLILENSVYAKEETILHVGAEKEYQTISEAISKAREMDQACKIEIETGIYEENIVLLNDTRPITFQGNGDVLVVSSCAYPYSTVYCAGNYDFSNMKFVQMNERCYAGHVEYCNVSHPSQCNVSFEDCLFMTQKGPAFGIGSGENTNTVFKNCRFISTDQEKISLFLHNYPGKDVKNQKMKFSNCYFNQNILISDSAFLDTFQNSKLEVVLETIEIDGKINYISDTNNPIMMEYIPSEHDISLILK